MSTIQIRIDDKLKEDSLAVLNKLNITPSEAFRQFLRYVAENQKLPFTEVSVMVADDDNDDDILSVVRERLQNPGKRIRVNIDEI